MKGVYSRKNKQHQVSWFYEFASFTAMGMNVGPSWDHVGELKFVGKSIALQT